MFLCRIRDVVRAIVSDSQWKTALMNTSGHVTVKAPLIRFLLNKSDQATVKTPFRRLIKSMPGLNCQYNLDCHVATTVAHY